MKINELLKHFDIHTNNEEKELLKRMSEPKPFLSYTDREQFVIEALIRKALVSKRVDNDTVLVMANDRHHQQIIINRIGQELLLLALVQGNFFL